MWVLWFALSDTTEDADGGQKNCLGQWSINSLAMVIVILKSCSLLLAVLNRMTDDLNTCLYLLQETLLVFKVDFYRLWTMKLECSVIEKCLSCLDFKLDVVKWVMCTKQNFHIFLLLSILNICFWSYRFQLLNWTQVHTIHDLVNLREISIQTYDESPVFEIWL